MNPEPTDDVHRFGVRPSADDRALLRSLMREPDLFASFAAADDASRTGEMTVTEDGGVTRIALISRDSQVETAGHTGAEMARLLANVARHGTAWERRQAEAAIAEIVHLLAEPYRGRIVPRSRPFAPLASLEHQLGRLRGRLPRITVSRRIMSTWTVVGFALSMVASVAILTGSFALAAGLIAFRTTVSVLFGMPGFASDHGRLSRGLVEWKACVAGHVGDAVCTSALAGWMLVNGRPIWGMAVAAVPFAMLGATMLRLAAAQQGVVLNRLYAERVARTGTLLIGLIGAALVGSNEQGILWCLTIAASGAAVYATCEIWWVLHTAECRRVLDVRDGRGAAFTRRFANVVGFIDKALPPEPPASATRRRVA